MVKTPEPFSMKIEDGILYGKYNVSFVDFDVAMYAFNLRIKLTIQKSYPILIDTTLVKSFSNEAKVLLSSKEAVINIIAGAILVKSVYQKLAGNFFVFVNKPPIPSRIFTDKGDAIKWLEQYKIKTE